MLFLNVLSFATTVLLGAAALANAQIAPGRYHISVGSLSARSFPPSGHQGGDRVPITLSSEPAGIYEEWNVHAVGDEKYVIENAAIGFEAYASPSLNAQVFADYDEQTSWFILRTDDGRYIVKIPFQDLLWTNSGQNTIALQGSDGSPTQRFTFQKV